MYWADKIAKEIVSSGKYKPYWVDDMKTPSGRIHVGSLRGVVIHDLIYKGLLDAKVKAKFTYVFDDHDPMDALPLYLEKEKWQKYLGMPLFKIPSPDGKAENYARYFAEEFKEVFNKIGCDPGTPWSSELYMTGKMNDGIKTCLDKVAIIRDIYEKTYKKKLADNWYPFQVVCPKCGKESTTKVIGWDGTEVTFECQVEGLDWTKGCGHKGKVSPFSEGGNYAGKLSWKVEWAVKWQVIGITVEGAGKDHMSAGGSHDIARQVSERVLGYPTPYAIAHEFFLIGGKKMSSSKGLGSFAKEVSETIPPYLLRFLFARTDYRQAINFDPVGTMYIPDLFDEYDRCWKAYNEDSDPDLARIFELSQIGKLPPKKKGQFIPRFRDIANYLQLPNIDLYEKFREIHGGELPTFEEKRLLDERENFARLWLGKYAPEEFRLQMSEKVPDSVAGLSKKQKEYLNKVAGLLDKEDNAEGLLMALYTLSKKMGLSSKDAFTAIYQSLIGKDHGPRAAWFLLSYPKEKVIKRLKESSK